MKSKIIKKKHIIRFIASFVICVSVTVAWVFSVNSYVKNISKSGMLTFEQALEKDVDCILVLGAGVWDNERPSHMLEDRLIVGIELYERGLSDRLLMSGDNGQIYYDEVNVMKNYAIDKGVPSSHIFMDHAGFSTYESMYRAKYIFGVETVIIVTQEYHLYRAVYIADKLGLEAYGVNSDPRGYLGQTYRDLREFFARNKDFIQCIFKPKPTFLGEFIPIDGDGDITND